MRQFSPSVTTEGRAPQASAARGSAAVDAPSAELVQLLAHLWSTVVGYVHERRDEGVPVERVIPEVKGLVREAAVEEPWVDPAGILTERVIRWAIDAYFDEPELGHVPRVY
jgi:hypothetical protein